MATRRCNRMVSAPISQLFGPCSFAMRDVLWLMGAADLAREEPDGFFPSLQAAVDERPTGTEAGMCEQRVRGNQMLKWLSHSALPAVDLFATRAMAADVTGSQTLAADVMGSQTLAADAMGSHTLAADFMGSHTLAADVFGSHNWAADVVRSHTLAADVMWSEFLK
ncbi:unnamed protein product [Closterium sp. NIES-65]|nr:unnamed protein product [Closterium sp. NIES-65]